MDSPQVDQLGFLRERFGALLRDNQPRTVGILGCATGNGLEAVDWEHTDRVWALDINPEYLSILSWRFAAHMDKIEVLRRDLETDPLPSEPVDLVFAALVLEYVPPGILIPKISRWLRPGGVFSCILQLPSDQIPEVTPSPYESLKGLSGIMRLVSQEDLTGICDAHGLTLRKRLTHVLHTGKAFSALTFRKTSA